MLSQVDTDQPIFLMVDQGVVKSKTSHRRPGPHIDGYWIEELQTHGGTKPGHRMHIHPWDTINLSDPESIILASDVVGCKGYVGDWQGVLREGGDCSDICLDDLSEMTMEANKAYIGNVSFIHESIPLPFETKRTLVRLNLKGI